MSKLHGSPREALADLLFDGMTIMSGGFGGAGTPESLIHAIRDSGVRDLTLISNNCGAEGFGLGILVQTGQLRRLVASYVGENKQFEQRYIAGEVQLELNPQGTLAERIRAGGAGVRAFYTKTGVGTVVGDGKPTETFDGEVYLREQWLRADLAIIKAWRGDPAGNLVYRKTARNFNPDMAAAAKVTVAEVQVLVGAGDIDPDHVHTPGIHVNRMVQTTIDSKRIEQRTVRTS